MIQEKKQWKKTELPAFAREFLTEEMLLFDIETTGLSPARDAIYCIGCGCCEKETVVVELFFAERPDEEEEVLRAFFSLAASFPTLITFNGATFDLPFLEKRASLLCGEEPHLNASSHIDLYREAKSLRRLLNLPSYKQKDIECFLGCAREDEQSGKELIDLWLRYTVKPDPEIRRLLLLHNRDDVRGMFDLLAILAYRQFADGAFTITDFCEETIPDGSVRDRESGGDTPAPPDRFLDVTMVPRLPLPQSIHRTEPELSFVLDRERSLLRLPIRHGTLKHFFPEYREYYYLPEEDTAIHQSVGAFVDPAHRERATKQTCYVTKECDYVALPSGSKGSAEGVLRKEYTDPKRYLEMPVSKEALKERIVDYFSQLS